MVMSISIGQNPAQEMQKKQEATKSSEEVSLFPETLLPQTRELMEAAQEICEKVSRQDFRSTTAEGDIDPQKYSLRDKVIDEIRGIRKEHDLYGAANPATALSDFRYVYGSKTFSKVAQPDGSVLRFGNCGEKACAAFLNLVKRHSEKFHSIEMVTLYFRFTGKEHMFLVLNRDQSEISPNPYQWKPMLSCDQVIVCDPSFNRVFLAQECDKKMMLYTDSGKDSKGNYNQYCPYDPKLVERNAYRMETRNRFEPRNPLSNEFLASYAFLQRAEEGPHAMEKSTEIQQGIKKLRASKRDELSRKFPNMKQS